MNILETVLPKAGEAILDDNERLIIEGEAAAERYHKSREQILPMARGLAAAKRKYPATREFGEWLQNSSYSRIGKQDRAALIEIGEQLDEHEAVVVEFLSGTDFISPQTIMAEIRKKLQPVLSIDSSYYHSNSKPVSTDANQPANEKRAEPESSDVEQDIDPTPPIEPVEPAASHKLYGTDKRFDRVVLTPRKEDLARLRDASLDKLGECLPVRAHVGDAAAVVIAAKITDLPVVIDRLLPLCGFNRPKRILILGQPASPDVIGAKVLVTAERGDIAFRELPGVWLDDADEPIEIAQKLYDASSTLHLFAAAKAKKADDSRCVIVGDDCWQKWPVL
jgi:hypothetical protein